MKQIMMLMGHVSRGGGGGQHMPADELRSCVYVCVYINELVGIKYTPQCTQKLSKHDLRNMLQTCDCCSFAGTEEWAGQGREEVA